MSPCVGSRGRAARSSPRTIFTEDTPIAALERLRPDVWVKGGDYAAADLPEAPVLAAWDGSAVILPFVEGAPPPD